MVEENSATAASQAAHPEGDADSASELDYNIVQELAGLSADWRRSAGNCGERNRLVRRRLDHILHSRVFHIGVIVLVVLDAVVVIAELAIDLGLLESGGKESLEHSVWPHVLHSISLAILCIFMLETCLKLYAMGKMIIKHKMELFDIVVIVISFALDVATLVPGSKLTALSGLVVLLRLWRIVRIVNSIALSIRLQGEEALAKQAHLRKHAEARCSELEARLAELAAALTDALDLVDAEEHADEVQRLRELLLAPTRKETEDDEQSHGRHHRHRHGEKWKEDDVDNEGEKRKLQNLEEEC